MATAQSAVLFVVDGLRPDGWQQAHTPVMDRLAAAGASTVAARTVMPSVSLPCHTSLFYGVAPDRHGITTNVWQPPARPTPNLCEVVHAGGRKVLMFFNWSELRDMAPPRFVDESHFFSLGAYHGDADTRVCAAAVERLRTHDFGFAFVYFGWLDLVGHAEGWMSDAYLECIAETDRALGRVIDVLPSDCLVVVTSDHGGHGKTHGTDDDQDMTIPLILAGPGVAGTPGGRTIDAPVNIVDIAPTISQRLGLAAPEDWSGRAIHLETN